MTAAPNYPVTLGAGISVAAIAGGGSADGGSSATASISGVLAVGGYLTASLSSGTAATWQWQRDGVAIGGATTANYSVVSADATHNITVLINGAVLSSGVSIPAQATFRSLGLIGANIEQPNSTFANRMFTNAWYNGARMQKPAQPFVNCNRDPVTGWPTEAFYVVMTAAPSNGVGGTFDGALAPGTYTWSYTYDNTLGATTVSSSTAGNTPLSINVSGFSTGTPTVVGTRTTVPFTFTLASFATLTLSFSGPITFADCPIDGQATTVGQPMYRDEALAYYSQNSIIRLLDFWSINGLSHDEITWANRPPNYQCQLAQDILSWERGFELFNELRNYPGSLTRTLKINLPGYTGAAYAGSLAALANSFGIPAGACRIEYGNELWNTNFSSHFNGFQWPAMNDAHGIANYQLSATYNVNQPDPIYTGPGIQLLGLSIDTVGTVTATLAAACNTYVDPTTGVPFIVNGAQAVIACATAIYNKGNTLVVNNTNTVTITVVNPTDTTFTYSTGVAGAATSFTGTTPATQIYFNPSSTYLADNLGFTVAQMRVKWGVQATYAAQQAWQAVRPAATYQDKWYLNIAPLGGIQGGSKSPPFEAIYSKYIDGTGAWLYGLGPAPYCEPQGTVLAFADLYDNTKTTSLYSKLNGAGVSLNIDNGCRSLVYLCIMNGWVPLGYEAGTALDTSSSSAFAIQAAGDSRTETFYGTYMQTVLQNGVQEFIQFNSSPRVVVNGSSGNSQWQSCQAYTDSNTSGDATYSAKKAGLQKFNAPAVYTNINGSDLTTLALAYFQVAATTANMQQATFFNTGGAATGMLFWGTGTTSLTRYIDWVYCVNSLAPRTITVTGNDGVSCPVKVIAYPNDLSGPVLLGTVHVGGTGGSFGNVSTSSTVPALACADPLTWAPPIFGTYVIRLQIDAGNGSAPGILNVIFS